MLRRRLRFWALSPWTRRAGWFFFFMLFFVALWTAEKRKTNIGTRTGEPFISFSGGIQGSREREGSAVFCAISSPGSSQLEESLFCIMFGKVFFSPVPDITKGLMNFAPRTESWIPITINLVREETIGGGGDGSPRVTTTTLVRVWKWANSRPAGIVHVCAAAAAEPRKVIVVLGR